MNMQDILDIDLTKMIAILFMTSAIIAYTVTLFILLFMTDDKVKHLNSFIWVTGVTVLTVFVTWIII